MNEQQALVRMISPSMRRKGKPAGGVIQIWLTRACDKSCVNCTQASNFGGRPGMMKPEQFEIACRSLTGYFGTVGIFGGNPALNPHFEDICKIARRYFPKKQLGLWCNNPVGKGKIMRETFNSAVSNLNVHFDQEAFNEFKRDWPESKPFGLKQDSRHSPVYVSMKDVVEDEGERWELISNCDINKHWSAMVGVYRGEVRGWFCEIAGAQAMLYQYVENHPDTGIPIDDNGVSLDPNGHPVRWWRLGMNAFKEQVREHCHNCGVPLRGYGSLAVTDPEGKEQVSETYSSLKPKRKDRPVEVVALRDQLGRPLQRTTHYLQNARK